MLQELSKMVRDVKEQSGRRKGWVRYNFTMIMLVVILLVVVMLVVIFFMLVNFDGDLFKTDKIHFPILILSVPK